MPSYGVSLLSRERCKAFVGHHNPGHPINLMKLHGDERL